MSFKQSLSINTHTNVRSLVYNTLEKYSNEDINDFLVKDVLLIKNIIIVLLAIVITEGFQIEISFDIKEYFWELFASEDLSQAIKKKINIPEYNRLLAIRQVNSLLKNDFNGFKELINKENLSKLSDYLESINKS